MISPTSFHRGLPRVLRKLARLHGAEQCPGSSGKKGRRSPKPRLEVPRHRRGRFVATIRRPTFGVFDSPSGAGEAGSCVPCSWPILSSRVRDHCVIAGTDNDNKHRGRRDLARRGPGGPWLFNTDPPTASGRTKWDNARTATMKTPDGRYRQNVA